MLTRDWTACQNNIGLKLLGESETPHLEPHNISHCQFWSFVVFIYIISFMMFDGFTPLGSQRFTGKTIYEGMWIVLMGYGGLFEGRPGAMFVPTLLLVFEIAFQIVNCWIWPLTVQSVLCLPRHGKSCPAALPLRIQARMQAEDRNGVDVVLPKQMPHAPFDWQHANLEPLRQVLLDAQRKGLFTPQPGLPL